MKYVCTLFSAFLLLSATAHSQGIEKLDSLIDEALANSPEVGAATYKMWAAQEKIPQASALDDPELDLSLMEIPGTNFGQAMYATVGIMQMIRFPSKLSTQHAIAETEAEHAHHDHVETMLDVITRLKSSYAMLRYARTAADLNKSNEQFLQQVVSAATTQYSVGRGTQSDVLKSNIELARQRAQLETVRQQVIGAEGMLKAILNRPSDKPIGSLEDNPPKLVLDSVDDLVRYAVTHRPMLIHDSLNVFQSSLNLTLMKQEYIPDLRIGLEYVRMPAVGENRWTVSAGISLPFAPWSLSKASSRVEEASANQSMLQSTFEASRRMVEAQIRDSYAQTKALQAELDAYHNVIIPQTDQSLKASLREYQTNQSSFLMLLDSYRMYKETQMEAAMARMKYDQALASLERNVGVVDINEVSPDSKDEQP
ncbi:MAG TPA: TolC family protein [Bacteroidota bacterium]